MLRFMLGSAVLLTALLVVPIAATRARPYEGSALHAFLTPPDNCPAPCFMDIQPGVITIGKALDILKQHDWVQAVDIMKTPVLWTWSGQQPVWIDERAPGRLATEHFPGDVRDDAVTGISFQSRLALADVYLLLGPPDLAWFRPGNPALRLPPIHAVYYEAYGLQLRIDLHCPVRLASVWRQPVEMSFAAVPSRSESAGDSELIFPESGANWPRSSPVC